MTKLAKAPAKKVGAYFVEEKSHLQFVHSGAKLLDLPLGGGYVLGRVVNIVGNSSTGKTLLAIEACAQIAIDYPQALVRYREAEAAFDKGYAEALGMPLERVQFWDAEQPFETVEQLFKDLEEFIKSCGKRPGLYVLDSLDALSDTAELNREIDKGSYGTAKAKAMSSMFRQLIRKLNQSNICLIIISQLRDRIGFGFGDPNTRAGGRALDFYATHIIHLHHLKTLNRTIQGVQRKTGIHVKAYVKKNKIAMPFREAEFDILFGYGIDNVTANLDWLMANKRLDKAGFTEKAAAKLVHDIEQGRMEPKELKALDRKLDQIVDEEWRAIESRFLPHYKKYAAA
jgi:recombination protein RecA